ncbi:MAG: MBL fold metallo-hydrolase [Ardenticatenales bacterium]
MQLQFWGAARTVTGSMHLVIVGGRRLLLDCGLYQGPRKIAFERNRVLPFDARSIDAVILSHAHIDHSGNLASLVKNGFRGPIYTSEATKDLCSPMLLDSAHIQESDVEYVNRRREARHERPFEPLYTTADVEATLGLIEAVPFHQPFTPIPGVEARLVFAGHIIGAASVILDLSEPSAEPHGPEKRRRLVFSGDIGRTGMPIVPEPELPEGAEILIMESTYGNRNHDGTGEAKELLRQIVTRKVKEGGKLLIPAFAVGRTQEILFRLNELVESGQLPRVQVFVDSPLAIKVTEVLRSHPEAFRPEMAAIIAADRDHDPLGFPGLRFTRTADESKMLNTLQGPAVIIAASGMCEGGRILHHLKNHIGDRTTTVLFVGFQAENTLGRKILDGMSPVLVYGESHPVRAEISSITGYSAHADHDELVTWAEGVHARGAGLKRTFLVHGEVDAAMALAADLRTNGMGPVDVPDRGQIIDL